MRTCGLRFQEASELRHQAIKECPNVTPKSQNQNPKENSIKAIEGWQKIGVETAKEKAPTVQPLQNETPDQTKIDVCDTCGDPTFSCDCSCKRLEEIPFWPMDVLNQFIQKNEKRAERYLEVIEDMMNDYQNRYDFAEETLVGIYDHIIENNSITDKQIQAVDNIRKSIYER